MLCEGILEKELVNGVSPQNLGAEFVPVTRVAESPSHIVQPLAHVIEPSTKVGKHVLWVVFPQTAEARFCGI
jgi:hypothetical protein